MSDITISGGVSRALIRRPADVGLAVEIEGGATRLELDETELGAAGGAVRQWTPSAAGTDPAIAVHVSGGASGLTIGALSA